jgi:AcrR family transcriptional regulator
VTYDTLTVRRLAAYCLNDPGTLVVPDARAQEGGLLQEPLVGAPRETDPVALDGAVARLLDAALACIARVGVTKTTLDDVAREARCSRATLYRYFPGKPALMTAVVAREAAGLEATLQAAAAETSSLADAVAAVMLAAARWLVAQPALSFVMTAEPEVLLPHLAFDGADRVLQSGARVVAPSLERFLGPESRRAAEWLTRMILSYVCSPTDSVDLADPISVRRLVGDFVVPGFSSIVDSPRG